MKLLKGKTALITGGSDGIGFGISETFAKEGANLVLIGRNEEKLSKSKEILTQYGGDVFYLVQDLGDSSSAQHIKSFTTSQNISIDILVNNAGIGRFIPFADSDETVLDFHLNLNIRTPYLLTRAYLDDLTASKGNIINISSYFAGRMLPDRPSSAYSMTKGGLNSLTKALAFELGLSGIRVNAVAPGTVSTPQVEKNLEALDRKAQERFKNMINTIYPLQHLGTPEDIGRATAFLASDQAKWITGVIFSVDGGLTTN